MEAWADSKIDVGDDWETKIQEAMAQASIAVLLITHNFLTSDYIMTKEVPFLLERRRTGWSAPHSGNCRSLSLGGGS